MSRRFFVCWGKGATIEEKDSAGLPALSLAIREALHRNAIDERVNGSKVVWCVLARDSQDSEFSVTARRTTTE